VPRTEPIVGGLSIRQVPWSIWLIFGLCLVPELAFDLAELGLWADPRLRFVALDYFAFWAGLLDNWRPNYPLQPWLMFLTYGFLHAGPTHFLVNVVTLLSLGTPVAMILGNLRFLGLYLVLLIAGAAGFALVPELHAPMVGASGALFGLAGMVLGWDLQDRRRAARSLQPVLRSVGLLIVLNLALWWAMHGQLAWQTHLGGFVAGWGAAWLMPARRRS
jgi:rhomboid protease GluP